jgi:uncharacterized membrane protein YGL010W
VGALLVSSPGVFFSGRICDTHIMKPALRQLFEQYDDFHRHPTNRLTHKIAIPLIVFHIVAMLSWVPLVTLSGYHLTLAHVGLVAAAMWYLKSSVKLGIIMTLSLMVALWLSAFASVAAVVTIAVVGWLVQLAGHSVWEKRSPAFLTNLLQALVGPLYFIALLTGDWSAPAQMKHPESPSPT